MLRDKGYGVTVVNAGVYGNTTTAMRNRLETDIPSDAAIVILDSSGGFFNNANQGISREQGDADMAAITASLRARGVRIIPESSADIPPEYRQADGRRLTPEGHKLLAGQLLPQVIDVSTLFRTHDYATPYTRSVADILGLTQQDICTPRE